VDARRALLARLVLEHRLSAHDPLAPAEHGWEDEAAGLIFADRTIVLKEILGLLS
jgi:hypothetical protein